jgi:hypothetical protein
MTLLKIVFMELNDSVEKMIVVADCIGDKVIVETV